MNQLLEDGWAGEYFRDQHCVLERDKGTPPFPESHVLAQTTAAFLISILSPTAGFGLTKMSPREEGNKPIGSSCLLVDQAFTGLSTDHLPCPTAGVTT